MERVVVTGIGVVSALGIGLRRFWDGLLQGRSGIRPITSFPTKGLRNVVAAEIGCFSPEKYISSNHLNFYGKASQYAITAATLALQDANLNSTDNLNTLTVDVVIGTTMGECQAIETIDADWVRSGEKSVQPRHIAQYPSSNIASNVLKHINGSGRCIVIPTACAAGNYAIGYGYDLIRAGISSYVLAGGADAFSRIAYTGFSRMLAMAEEKCSPFDKNRRGMLLGEGAAILVLESLAHAKRRGAKIYAEVLGYGLSCDANHMTIPNTDGIAKAIMKAIAESGISLTEVDYISAHGTGTPANDEAECAALRRVFGAGAKSIPVSSIKSMIGHAMGAASALEAVTCCMAVFEDMIPPTMNYECPDDKCDIDCVPNKYRRKRVQIALNNSFAFGGNNSCVVFAKVSNL